MIRSTLLSVTDILQIKSLWRASLALAALAMSACMGEPAGPQPEEVARTAASSFAQGAGRIKTIDDEFVELSKSVPGFGGLFYDSTGTLTVHLKDPGTTHSARTAVGAFLASREPPGMNRALDDVARMRVLVGRYDFAELAGYYSVIRAALPGTGITITDIDDRSNRIEIGVVDAATAQAVRVKLGTLGIPGGGRECSTGARQHCSGVRMGLYQTTSRRAADRLCCQFQVVLSWL